MNHDILITMIGQYGYAALFFALWLGIVGMPIPDEVIVMTGGAVTAGGMLSPVPAFLLTYLGVASGLTLGYVLGKYAGAPVLAKLRRKKKMDTYMQVCENLTAKYGNAAICISYLLPVVRHVMPYLVGMNRMPFRRYALYSYSAGFVWTLVFFMAGRMALNNVQAAMALLYEHGLQLLWLPVVLIAVVVIVKHSSRKKRLSHNEER